MKAASMHVTKLLALTCALALANGLYAQDGDGDGDGEVFRKNISKTADLASAKAKMNIMPVYIPMTAASDDPVCPAYSWSCEPDLTKPVVITYTDEEEGLGASDVYAAVTRDDGATWKRKNLSKTAEESSFDVGLTPYPGHSRKPVLQVQGNYMLVAWSDKFCKKGSARYSLTDDLGEPLYEDVFGVAGDQGSIDYDEVKDAEGMGLGEVPFSCVWVARGLIVTDKELDSYPTLFPRYKYSVGDIVWYKPERITSGRRDAYQLFLGGKVNAGFALTWQEDPEGLRPGQGDGPGEGFSGATTNHKTDIWYSFIKWSDFLQQETEPATTFPSFTSFGDDLDKMPQATNRMSMPVRISDNDICTTEHADPLEPKGNAHAYCQNYCPDSVQIVSNGGTDQNVCVTTDGRLLNGDTGASRPNIFLQPKTGGAYAILAYEETKGVGTGNSGEDEEKVDPEDIGKDIIYHSFDFTKPETVSGGEILNLPQVEMVRVGWSYVAKPIWIEGEDLTLESGDGTINTGRWATENARRVRFILQSKKGALAQDKYCNYKGEGTPLIAVYKQGMLGKGRPSDIMLRRMDIYENGIVTSGNPYAFKNFTCDEYVTDPNGNKTCLDGALNMSSVTPVTIQPKEVTLEEDGKKVMYDKLLTWRWTQSNLKDESWETPMTEARAHRGQIRGDFVVMGFTWTPNWAAHRNGNDKYDFIVRRSFDAGKTWDTTHHLWPDGVTDILSDTEPRNVSMVKNNKESVIEPRIVATPGTIWKVAPKPAATFTARCAMTKGELYADEDKQDKSVFHLSYGLEVNWKKGLDYETDEDKPAPLPTDMYFARSTDQGDSYTTVWNDNVGEYRWDWLANRHYVAEGEAQLRSSPDGSKFYSSYASESEEGMVDESDHFYGSDIWFRKVEWVDEEEFTWFSW